MNKIIRKTNNLKSKIEENGINNKVIRKKKGLEIEKRKIETKRL